MQPSKTPPFLMWFDDHPKTSIPARIDAACAAYRARFGGVAPTLVLVCPAEAEAAAGGPVAVQAVASVRPNTYWIGQADA